MTQLKKQIIAYKIVCYIYGSKNDSGALICAFDKKNEAEDYKLKLIQETKHNMLTYIYSIEPVYEYFNFIDFLTSGSNKALLLV